MTALTEAQQAELATGGTVALEATLEAGGTITRAWHDLAPKLLAFLASGLTASLLIAVASALGLEIPVELANAIVLAVGALAGYFVKDNATGAVAVVAEAEPAEITG